MRQISLSFLFLFTSLFLFAQKNGIVKGVAFDTLSKQAIREATITLMKKKDSSLVSFTMADDQGRFEISAIPNGEYRLLLTHVSYRNSDLFFTIDDNHKNIELGNVVMNDRNHVLSEVVVKSEAPPVTLIGDTIQYNAGSFKTQPNANVEDLLKKLPGVKVDKDGTIKAQGEKVQKVLVDGKEFFGDDPKIATKNLPADAIDKVQVYDKLSDQAQMTGFDDGNSQKTINLKLKKDRKKGYFGKATAGGGDDGRYEGRFNLNSFKGARQASVIGMGNNVNAQGFSFMDMLNFTGAKNLLKNNGGGNVSIEINDDDPLAGLLGGNNTGINTTWGGGLNYNNLIGEKTDFQSNYFYSHYDPLRVSHIQRQYFSPANLYTQNSRSEKINDIHRFNVTTDYQVDSFQSIKFTPSFGYQHTRSNFTSDYQTLSDQSTRTNDGSSQNYTTGDGTNAGAGLLYRKKFRRHGRTFSMNLVGTLNNSNGDGRLKTNTNFYDPAGNLFQRDSVNQVNHNTAGLKGYNARAVYTEPLFKRSLLEFSAGKSTSINTTERTTYDYNALSGKFDQVNHPLTNDFKNNYNYLQGGLRLLKQGRQYNYAAGVSWQQADMEGNVVNGIKDSIIGKRFNNLLPTARFEYRFSKFKNISLNYNSYTNQPTVSQLQPVPDNSNPLYVRLGNPNLKQEFTQSARLTAAFINPYRNHNFFAFIGAQETQNRIVNYDKISNLGVDSVRYANVNGVYNINGQFSWGLPLRPLKGSMELSSSAAYLRGKQLYNQPGDVIATNKINTFSAGPSIRFDMNPTEKINLSLSAGITYNKTIFSIQSAANSVYTNQDYSLDVNYELPKGFYFSSDFSYHLNGQQAAGFDAKTSLWDASLSKQVLHYNRGEIKFSAHDLLNQNVGISRNTNQNYVEDSRVNNLKRYFMLSFTYNLTKTGLSNQKTGQRIMMR